MYTYSRFPGTVLNGVNKKEKKKQVVGDLSNNREAISENHFHLEKRIDTAKYS